MSEHETERGGPDEGEVEWEAVAEYGARYEVEIPAQTLENAGIPVLVHGIESGIWGPGFAGPTSRGITLLVPAERADEARELLELS